MCHREHPLVLQFNTERLSCKICQSTQRRGFVYCCSPCKFVIHIDCAFPPPVVEEKNHPHPFTRLLRRVPFVCDACGTEGIYVSHVCSTCNIVVHKKCISLPRVIKSKWHDHRIFHKYFLPDDFRSLDCIICHDKVNSDHGSYSCSYCNITSHVNCVIEDKDSYFIVLDEDDDELSYESSINVLERNDAREATKIKHCKHGHNLMLSSSLGEHENSCDGCMLSMSDPFYCCSECDFLLHKACTEFPRMKHVWHHPCQIPLRLISDEAFQCEKCWQVSNAFAYECCECEEKTRLQCVIALTPGAQTCSKHDHPLFYYRECEGQCNACGNDDIVAAFRCKDSDFVLDLECFSLPITAHQKCDEHLLKLIYRGGNNYPESHYCDICEESRDPNRWFYRCTLCDTYAHVNCVLGKYPFIKLGRIYEEKNHPHPLAFVKKSYYYPDCGVCGEPCEDLALECSKSGCNYIVHWNWVAPDDLQGFCFYDM
ncbi:uncharacterized protein LOC120218552 [Hibiscus syriacus]|uniref:uncharacterized protein LOC120218552 n=1 Tax=Hibiscus syriacus TaxID=106335 RepID=UPI001921B4B7|nr:uncharacterized protein LOC120218552 [Hibiscus syriacus]